MDTNFTKKINNVIDNTKKWFNDSILKKIKKTSINEKTTTSLENSQNGLEQVDGNVICNEMKNFVFEKGIYKDVRLLDNSLPFAKLHTSNNEWSKYLLVILIGAISSILTLFFIKNTGLYSFGLSSFFQGISRIIYTSVYMNSGADLANIVYNALFWGLYFMFNIPLLIFSYIKISKSFTKFTTVFLIFSTIVGFSLDFIPGIENIYLLGSTDLIGSGLATDPITKLTEFGQQIIPFSVPSAGFENFDSGNYIKSFYLFLYGTVYGLAVGVLYAMVYIVGGCTAGMDIVSVYYATQKQKNIGIILLELNLANMFIGSLMGTYGSAIMIDPIFSNFQFLFSANFIFTIISMVAFTMVFNKLFPKSKLVDVNIITEKFEEINESLIKVKYTHTTSLHKITGGYSKKEKVVLTSICMQIEVASLIKFVRAIDPKAIITVNPVIAYDGIMKIQQQRSK